MTRLKKICFIISIPCCLTFCFGAIVQAQTLQVKIIKLQHADAANIFSVVGPLKSRQGKISYDRNTNSMIIYDSAENIERIQNVIAELDVPTKQIKIMVTTVETSAQSLDELGIHTIFSNIPKRQFDDFLKMSSTQQRVKIRSQAQVTALDNQKASLNVTEDKVIGYQTSIYPNYTTISQVRSPIGNILEVTPRVNNDKTVSLDIANINDQGDPNARSLSTHIKLTNGDTVVVGMTELNHNRSGNTRFMGLASSKAENDQDIQVVAFLTAIILE